MVFSSRASCTSSIGVGVTSSASCALPAVSSTSHHRPSFHPARRHWLRTELTIIMHIIVIVENRVATATPQRIDRRTKLNRIQGLSMFRFLTNMLH